jgi:hypothetical protein
VPEITPAIIALREAVKAYESVPRPNNGEPLYDSPECRAALELYMTATNQTDKVEAAAQVKEHLARLRDARATAQLYFDIAHTMSHAFDRSYDVYNQVGAEQLATASREANNTYYAVLSSLGMSGGLGSLNILAQLSSNYCKVCRSV